MSPEPTLHSSGSPAEFELRIDANRRAAKWSFKELFLRTLWALCQPAFRFSPRVLWGWRRCMLRVFGAAVGRNVHVYPTATVTIPWNLRIGDFASVGDHARIYNLGHVTIGRAVTISQFAHLCAGTHDYTRADLPLVKSPVRIEDGAWICADAFIGPNVTVASHAIVGARAVVVRDVGEWTIVAGNPAKFVRRRPALKINESLRSPSDV